MTYLDALPTVAQRHVERLTEAHKHYGNSCLKRGGVGLFMMLARKWDRIENRVRHERSGAVPWDILEHIKADPRPEGVADDVRDLIDYLMIVEAELTARGDMPAEIPRVQGETTFGRPDVSHPFGYEGDCEHCGDEGCGYCGA